MLKIEKKIVLFISPILKKKVTSFPFWIIASFKKYQFSQKYVQNVLI